MALKFARNHGNWYRNVKDVSRRCELSKVVASLFCPPCILWRKFWPRPSRLRTTYYIRSFSTQRLILSMGLAGDEALWAYHSSFCLIPWSLVADVYRRNIRKTRWQSIKCRIEISTVSLPASSRYWHVHIVSEVAWLVSLCDGHTCELRKKRSDQLRFR